MRILLVEDQEALRSLFVAVLSKDGHIVDSVAGGDEAMRLYSSQGPYDAVLTDIDHPGLNGRDLAHQIQAKNPDQRVGFLTAYVLPPELPSLKKPFSGEELLSFVKTFTT
jgi:CheY-like chemotaxis protein